MNEWVVWNTALVALEEDYVTKAPRSYLFFSWCGILHVKQCTRLNVAQTHSLLSFNSASPLC